MPTTGPRVIVAPTQDQEDSDLCDLVQDDTAYQQLLAGFLDAAIERAGTGQGDPAFAPRYRDILTRLVAANQKAVDEFQHVSIEQILLRSLVLGALKWDPLGLVVEPFGADPLCDARDHRAWYGHFGAAVQPRIGAGAAWPDITRPAGRAPQEPPMESAEAAYLELLAFRQRWFNRHRTVHLSLAPPFSEADAVDPPLRTDLWFWKPSEPGFAVIAECAGFQPHSRTGPVVHVPPPENAHALRFPGIDIFRNPIGVCSEILAALH